MVTGLCLIVFWSPTIAYCLCAPMCRSRRLDTLPLSKLGLLLCQTPTYLIHPLHIIRKPIDSAGWPEVNRHEPCRVCDATADHADDGGRHPCSARASWRSNQMRVDIFPSINAPQIYVVNNYAGMDPSQIEGIITNVYEQNFQYVDGLKKR